MHGKFLKVQKRMKSLSRSLYTAMSFKRQGETSPLIHVIKKSATGRQTMNYLRAREISQVQNTTFPGLSLNTFKWITLALPKEGP